MQREFFSSLWINVVVIAKFERCVNFIHRVWVSAFLTIAIGVPNSRPNLLVW